METNCARFCIFRAPLTPVKLSFSLDMVSVGSDQQTLTIHLWDHGKHQLATFSYPSFVTFSNSTKNDSHIGPRRYSNTIN